MSDDDGQPRRRSMDRDRWSDDRLDAFERQVLPAATMAAAHKESIDELRERMDKCFDRLRDELGEQLRGIYEEARKTNGRLGGLEDERARREGATAALATLAQERADRLKHRLQKSGLAIAAVGVIAAVIKPPL